MHGKESVRICAGPVVPLPHRGYSLVEMMVVLVIVGLLMALVAPNLPGVLGNTRMKSAAREIAASLKTHRDKAVYSSDEMAVVFNVEKMSYGVGDQTRSLNLPQGASLNLVTAESEQISEDQGAIRFFRDGSSTGGQVKLAYKDNAYVVDVNWLTGKVTIYP